MITTFIDDDHCLEYHYCVKGCINFDLDEGLTCTKAKKSLSLNHLLKQRIRWIRGKRKKRRTVHGLKDSKAYYPDGQES